MAKLRSIILRNYRRFAGEIALPLDPGTTMVIVPPGHGKSTVLEAIAWGLLGTALVPRPGDVPNADAVGAGQAEVMVGLEFVNGERLERSAWFSRAGEEVKQERWGWRLVDAGSGTALAEGDDGEDFADQQERLFPEGCVHANLISGPGLGAALRGARTGAERAVECSNVWCTSDLSLRASMEATGLFLSWRPDAPVNTLGFDPQGRPEVSACGPLDEGDLHLALLALALAFAKENGRTCPVLLDDPFGPAGDRDRMALFGPVLEAMDGRQLVFLLSDELDALALRSTGRVDKELEIRG